MDESIFSDHVDAPEMAPARVTSGRPRTVSMGILLRGRE